MALDESRWDWTLNSIATNLSASYLFIDPFIHSSLLCLVDEDLDQTAVPSIISSFPK